MTRNKQEEKLVDDIIEKLQPYLKKELPDKWKRSFAEYLAILPKIDMLKMKEIVYGYFRLLQ